MRGLGVVLAVLMAPTVVRAECTNEERAALARMGYSAEQVDVQCNAPVEDRFAPAAGPEANYCATQDGYCPLSRPDVAGADCVCDSPYGPVRGVAE